MLVPLARNRQQGHMDTCWTESPPACLAPHQLLPAEGARNSPVASGGKSPFLLPWPHSCHLLPALNTMQEGKGGKLTKQLALEGKE